MTTQSIPSLTWVPVGDKLVANQTLTYASPLDTFELGLFGTALQTGGVTVAFVVVDNTANVGVVTMSYGQLTYSVSPYTRKTFELVIGSGKLVFVLQGGSVPLTFCNFDPKIPDDTNQVLAAATGQTITGAPGYVFYNNVPFNISQPVSDFNKVVVFGNNHTTGTEWRYFTQQPAISGSYWMPLIYNRHPTHDLYIFPGFGAVVNTYQASAAPIVLPIVCSPGQSIQLYVDVSGVAYAF